MCLKITQPFLSDLVLSQLVRGLLRCISHPLEMWRKWYFYNHYTLGSKVMPVPKSVVVHLIHMCAFRVCSSLTYFMKDTLVQLVMWHNWSCVCLESMKHHIP